MSKSFDAQKFERQFEPMALLKDALKLIPTGRSSVSQCRTLVIAIDGISLDKVEDMVSKGLLPTFKMLINSGASGKMNSTIPPDSLPAWPSFITGKNPAKHGVTGYYRYDKNILSPVVVNASMIDEPRYWDIFSDFGLNSVVMNIPLSFPPERINGIMISDYLSPKDENFCYPAFLCEPLRKVGYFTELAVTKFFDYDLSRPEPYVYKMNKTKDTALCIMENYDWDMFTLGFMSPDKAHHMLGLNGEYIDSLYIKLDSILSEIMAAVDLAKTDLFIVSDHGAANYNKEFLLHRWLYENKLLGLVSINEQVRNFADKEHDKKASLWHKIMNLLYKIKVSFNLPSVPFFRFSKDIIDDNLTNPCPFDWLKTKAYSLLPPTSNYLPVTINTRGQRPFGIINQGREYELFRQELIKLLSEITDPDTGEKIVERVYLREEVFSGRFLNEMPDIIAKLKNEYIGFSGFSDRTKIISGKHVRKFKEPVLDHSIEALFIFCGPKANKNSRVIGLDIVDIFANVLYSRSLPIPEDLDGKVNKEIFNDSFLSLQEPRFKDYSHCRVKRQEYISKNNKKDIEAVSQELKKLGYIK
ncbi:MAG: hypothetical protein C4533_04255 [Candidatus Omnitrophota bacterium]|jgi:predicted AlkP superfamily phosphohydrolase/phosphomutase|nr:MAG: hypothetical protein C4533_04255 [Candidatus Omnitrophota bacterium]